MTVHNNMGGELNSRVHYLVSESKFEFFTGKCGEHQRQNASKALGFKAWKSLNEMFRIFRIIFCFIINVCSPQARFQKQQLEEKENRLLTQFQTNRSVLLNRISGGSGSTSTSAGSNSSTSSSSSCSQPRGRLVKFLFLFCLTFKTSFCYRKGRDKGNLLDPIDDLYNSNIKSIGGRFSKSSDNRANNVVKQKQLTKRNHHSVSPYKQVFS